MQNGTGGELAGQGNAVPATGFADLIVQLEDAAPAVRAGAIQAIGGFGREAQPPLMKALDDEDRHVRRSALEALASSAEHSIQFRRRLVDLLASEDLGEEAYKVLDRQGFACLSELIEALDRSEVQTPARILLQGLFCQAPGRGHDLEHHRDLLEALPSLSTMAQGLGALSLVRLACDKDLADANRELIPYLVETLGSEQAVERKQAALSLARMAALSTDPIECPLDRDVIEALTRTLSDEESTPRYAAAWALEMCGPAAVAAIPELQVHLADPDPLVQRSAAWALERIQNPDPRGPVPCPWNDHGE